MSTQTESISASQVLNLLAFYLPSRRYSGKASDWYEALWEVAEDHLALFEDFRWNKRWGQSAWSSGIDKWLTGLNGIIWVLHLGGTKWFQFPPEWLESQRRLEGMVSATVKEELQKAAQELSQLLPSAPLLVEELPDS